MVHLADRTDWAPFVRTSAVTLKLCQGTYTGQTFFFFLQCSQSHQNQRSVSRHTPATSHLTIRNEWRGFTLNPAPVTRVSTVCCSSSGERADPRSERGWASEAPVEGVGGSVLLSLLWNVGRKQRRVAPRTERGEARVDNFPNAAAARFKCAGRRGSGGEQTPADPGWRLLLLPDRGTN